jgi:hypothetical protein
MGFSASIRTAVCAGIALTGLLSGKVTAGIWTPLQIKSSAEVIDPLGGGEGEQHPRSFTRSPSHPAVLYAGIDTGGTWRSADHGVSWIKNRDEGLFAKGIQSIAVDPADPLKVYIFAEITTSNGSEMTGILEPLEGIWRSTDGGDSWRLIQAIPNPVNSELGNYRLNRSLLVPVPQPDGSTDWYAVFDRSGIWKLHDSNLPGSAPEVILLAAEDTEINYTAAVYTDSLGTWLLYGNLNGLFRRQIFADSLGPAVNLNVPVTDLPSTNQNYFGGINSLYINPVNPDEVWVTRRWDRPYRTTNACSGSPVWNEIPAYKENGWPQIWSEIETAGISMGITPYHTQTVGGAIVPSKGYLSTDSHLFYLDWSQTNAAWRRYFSANRYDADIAKRPGLLTYRKGPIGAHSGYAFNRTNVHDTAAYGVSTFWRTENGGVTSGSEKAWRQTGYGFTGFAVQNGLNGITVYPDNPDIKWFPWNDVGIAGTTNGGVSFSALGAVPVGSGTNQFDWATSANVAVNPQDSSILIAAIGIYSGAGFQVARSSDGGLSWLPAGGTNALAVGQLGAGIYTEVTDAEGIWHPRAFLSRLYAVNDDATDWNVIPCYADRNTDAGFEAPASNRIYVVAGASDGSVSSGTRNPTLYAVRQDGAQEILRGEPDWSKTGRYKWHRVYNDWARGIKHPAGSVVFAASPANRNIAFGALRDSSTNRIGTEFAQQICRFDFTACSNAANPGLMVRTFLPCQSGTVRYNNINSLAADPHDDRTVYVGTAAPGLPCVFKAVFNTDGTVTVEDLSADLPRTGALSITYDPGGGGRLMVGTFQGTWARPLAQPADAYAAFVTGYGLDPASSGASGADPDGDGWNNFMEYSFNRSPRAAEPEPPVRSVVERKDDDNYLTVTYTRRKPPADVVYIEKASGDLNTWRTGATVTVHIRDDLNGVSETVTSRLADPVSSTTRQFLGVTVTK